MHHSIYTVIDADTNRLMEGLRVVEEISRFVLRNGGLTKKIKDLRGKVKEAVSLAYEGDEKLLDSRNIQKDSGRKLYSGSEGKRTDISEIVTANIKRAQEAARVLEEFTKLIDPKIGKTFKEIRFELYEIEKQLCRGDSRIARTSKLNFDLYVVTDPDVLNGRSPVNAVREIIKGGCRMIQLRDKKASVGQYYKWAKQISEICRGVSKYAPPEKHVSFIVNDYVDICIALDADGVHLGQDDMPVSVARKLLGPEKIIGLSTHSYEQALKGSMSGADYISIGPIFATQSKPGIKPLGLDIVRAYCNTPLQIPFVAIGGINESNIKDVIKSCRGRFETGPYQNVRIAVIRAVVGRQNIAAATKNLRRAFK